MVATFPGRMIRASDLVDGLGESKQSAVENRSS